MAKKSISYEEIIAKLKKREFAMVYGLMGDETYFIDQISDYLEANVLNEEEREFNQILFYGSDVNVSSIIQELRQYPVMASHRVVIIKEAQMLKNIKELAVYFQKPLTSSILVLNYKYGKIDKSLVAPIEQNGVLFESKKLYDNQIPEWILKTLQQKNVAIDFNAAQLLADYVGNDLSRLAHELDKLILALSGGSNRKITIAHIEENIGISKEFNNFELLNAILNRDVLKANRIINYFEKNPKKNPLLLTLGVLFNSFSTLVLAYSLKDRSRESLMQHLDIKNTFKLREIQTGLNNYSPLKAVQAISLLREYDGKSKGMKGGAFTDAELLRELVYKLIH